MGTLVNVETGNAVELRGWHVIGRARSCDLVIRQPEVSGRHAVVRWTGTGWAIRDLGSRNGTWLDGLRLETGLDVDVPRGTDIAIGKPSRVWRLAEATPPEDFETIDQTIDTMASEPRVDNVTVAFSVSSDEEHVEMQVRHGSRRWDMRARAHNFTLLTLARLRLEERDDPNVTEGDEGWVYQDDLVKMLGIAVNALHVHIHRAREQFERAGIANAQDIVERRATGQIRMGARYLEVTRL